jgi:hypothetical protein
MSLEFQWLRAVLSLAELEIKQRHHDADSESELGKEQHVQPPQPCYTAQVCMGLSRQLCKVDAADSSSCSTDISN